MLCSDEATLGKVRANVRMEENVAFLLWRAFPNEKSKSGIATF